MQAVFSIGHDQDTIPITSLAGNIRSPGELTLFLTSSPYGFAALPALPALALGQ